MDHIGKVILKSFKHSGIKSKLREYKLFKGWDEIVGKAIYKRTSPYRLIGKTLYVSVSSSPWMSELHHLKEDIIKDLNKRVPDATVSDIVFRIGKVSKKECKIEPPKEVSNLSPHDISFIEETIAPIKDQELKALLSRTISKYKTQ